MHWNRGGQLLQSAGQMWENEVLGGPDYYINSIQYLNHIFIHYARNTIINRV